MNKIVSVVALVALTAVFSFSQEETLKFGVRLGFNLNMAAVPNADLGMGYGGGVQASIPIVKSPSITFNPEVDFFYRSIYSVDAPLFKADWTEFAVSVPLVFHYAPVEGQPLYVGLGPQFDIPFNSEIDTDWDDFSEKLGAEDGKEKVKNRAIPDIGLVVEAGYRITGNISVDARFVWGFTNLAKEVKYSYDQVGVGISYFF